MSDTTKKRLKFAGKLLFVCLLLGILYYSFRDSMGDMLTELANRVTITAALDKVAVVY